MPYFRAHIAVIFNYVKHAHLHTMYVQARVLGTLVHFDLEVHVITYAYMYMYCMTHTCKLFSSRRKFHVIIMCTCT